ncbi:MAG: hypothetical protein Q4A78_07285 [Peptostreptococcaceae bacterium]|nr:hypothetical protein [Peptostreptococcaceae bacterium]
MNTKLTLSFKQLLSYGLLMMITGILTGIGLKDSIETLLLRTGPFGGEILFLPMIALQFAAGYFSGRFFLKSREIESFEIGLRRGQSTGISMGMQLIEQLQREYGGEEHGEGNDHLKKAV